MSAGPLPPPPTSPHVEQVIMLSITVLHAVAVVITSLRLWIRARLRRLWWEDAWTALALSLDIVCAVSTWMLTLTFSVLPSFNPPRSRIISEWLVLLSSESLTWSTRISILFSLIRLIPHASRKRVVVNGCAISFIFLWILLPGCQCPIGLPVATINFTADVVSDFILISLPAWILWKLRQPGSERILISSILAMSLLSVMANIVHIIFLIPIPGFMARTAAAFEGALDLMTCNLLVLVTCVYRRLRNGEDMERLDNGFTRRHEGDSTMRTGMDTLTTIDLELFDTTTTVHSTKSAPVPDSGITPRNNVSPRSSFDFTV